MFTMMTQGSRRMVSAVAAVAVVAFAGLTLDQGHLGGLPEGSVSLGELTPVDVMQMAAITLPEVTITGQRVRIADGRRQATSPGTRAEVLATETSPSGSVLLK